MRTPTPVHHPLEVRVEVIGGDLGEAAAQRISELAEHTVATSPRRLPVLLPASSPFATT